VTSLLPAGSARYPISFVSTRFCSARSGLNCATDVVEEFLMAIQLHVIIESKFEIFAQSEFVARSDCDVDVQNMIIEKRTTSPIDSTEFDIHRHNRFGFYLPSAS
jgi:hypothetical protein